MDVRTPGEVPTTESSLINIFRDYGNRKYNIN